MKINLGAYVCKIAISYDLYNSTAHKWLIQRQMCSEEDTWHSADDGMTQQAMPADRLMSGVW